MKNLNYILSGVAIVLALIAISIKTTPLMGGGWGWQDNNYYDYKQIYASLADDDDAATLSLVTQNTYYGWTGASSTLSQSSGAAYAVINTTAGTTSTITIGAKGAGTYKIAYSASVSVNATSESIHCAIFHNGIKYRRASAEDKLGTISDVSTLASVGGFVTLAPGDVLDLRCTNKTSSGKTLTINHAALSIFKVSQ